VIWLANAPCSWGTIEFGTDSSARIEYAQMLDELAEAGYVGTELGDWGFMPTDPESLELELRRRNLAMVGAFVQGAFRDPGSWAETEERAVKTASLLCAVAESGPGASLPYLILADANGSDPTRARMAGRVTAELGLGPDEWRTYAAGVERVARAAFDATGLRTAFHAHCAGFVETPDETARLLDLTDPALVGLVLDTGHYTYGSGKNEPGAALAGLKRFGERVLHVHFKDLEPSVAAQARRDGWDYDRAIGAGVFCELGRGCIDFPSIVARLRERRYDGWVVVEQDVLPGVGEPRESALRSRKYLAMLGL
jgi:inosose dehydratase